MRPRGAPRVQGPSAGAFEGFGCVEGLWIKRWR